MCWREKLSINIAAMCCRWGRKNCFKKYEKVEKRDEFYSQFNSISKIVILFYKIPIEEELLSKMRKLQNSLLDLIVQHF